MSKWRESSLPSGDQTSSQKTKKQSLTPSDPSVIVTINETADTPPHEELTTTKESKTNSTGATIMADAQTGVTVSMEDGSQEIFGGKKKMLKVTTIADGKVVTKLSFLNGRIVTFTMPEDMVLRFAAHGADQKFGDEIAGLGDIDDAVLAIEGLSARLTGGEWSQKREGSGLGGTSVLAKALCEMYKQPMEKIKTFLAGKNQAEKIALRNNPKVKPFVDAVEAAKAAKAGRVAIDTESLLGELE